MITEHFFPTRESLFAALLEQCREQLGAALAGGRQASLLVSGGSTPQPLYEQLSEQLLDWQRVTVALVDERWVDVDDPASNQTFIANTLLRNRAAAATFVAMKSAEATAVAGVASAEQRYRQLPRPFDLTLLGMGADGHTASLFPKAQGLTAALHPNGDALCVAIEAIASEVTGALTERMTLSLSGLLQSRRLVLLISGEQKLAVYQRARDSADVALTPVSAVLQQDRVPVDVYWAP
ncbi:MAG: 6-phosphogluconolactonase [Paraglaciecola psychrophila]|jgi:6-phosphogluconolactonase